MLFTIQSAPMLQACNAVIFKHTIKKRGVVLVVMVGLVTVKPAKPPLSVSVGKRTQAEAGGRRNYERGVYQVAFLTLCFVEVIHLFK